MDYKIICTLGNIDFYWFGTIIAIGLVIGSIICLMMAKVYGESYRPITDILYFSVPVCLITARIAYVLGNWQLYINAPLEILFIWRGGLSLFGAMVGLLSAIYFYTKRKGFNFWHWADIIVPGLALGQAIGQWANLASQEAFGLPAVNTWGIYIDYAYRPIGYEQFDYFTPVFMYHSVWMFFVFIFLVFLTFINLRYKKKNKSNNIFHGSILVSYTILYGVGRIIFDGMCINTESVYGFRFPQLTGVFIMLTVFFMWFIDMRKRHLPGR